MASSIAELQVNFEVFDHHSSKSDMRQRKKDAKEFSLTKRMQKRPAMDFTGAPDNKCGKTKSAQQADDGKAAGEGKVNSKGKGKIKTKSAQQAGDVQTKSKGKGKSKLKTKTKTKRAANTDESEVDDHKAVQCAIARVDAVLQQVVGAWLSSSPADGKRPPSEVRIRHWCERHKDMAQLKHGSMTTPRIPLSVVGVRKFPWT